MCSFSNYWGSSMLDHAFGKKSYSSPDVYVGLLLSEPNENGSSIVEPQSQGYSRTKTNAGQWDTAFEGSIENVSNITFTMACENWGKITHFALFDAASGGNLLAFGNMSPSKNINSGDIPRFAPGDLIISLD